MTILEEIRAFKAAPNTLEQRYRDYIVDKSIPLSERWEVFKEAPDSWKEEDNYIVRFESENLLPGKRIDWTGDMYRERHETIYTVDFIEDSLSGEYGDEEDQWQWTEQIGNAFKEEVLQLNLVSFDLDW